MQSKILQLTLTLLVLAMTIPNAQAEILLDSVLVTARGSEMSQSQTPGGTGVVTKEEIALSPTASIADSLARIPGLTPTGESPWGQDISIRGMSGSSVVILIDGMRVNTATELNARLGFINPLDVERVEVLKGPVSALYGTGSTGGVVNIITKKGAFTGKEDVSGEFRGSYKTNPSGPDGYGRFVVSKENFWLQASAGYRNHEDVFGGEDSRVTNSQYEDFSLRLAGAYKFNDLMEMNFQAMTLHANNIGLPGGSNKMPQTASIIYPKTNNTLLCTNFVYTPQVPTIEEVALTLYFMKNKRQVKIFDFNPLIRSIEPRASHETWGSQLKTKLNFGPHAITAGIDAWKWHMVSKRSRYFASGMVRKDEPTPNTTQYSSGLFIEDNWVLNDVLSLNLGGRLDRSQVKNNENTNHKAHNVVDYGWNLHAGLTWEPTDTWSHTLLAATSYRVADILERYKNITLNGDSFHGNPEVNPEQSYFLEYGLHYNTPTCSASASAYVNYLSDAIEDQLVAAQTYRVNNIGKARIYGAELEAIWHALPMWDIYGNIAAANGRDIEHKTALRRIAPLNGRLGIKYHTDKGFWASLEVPWALRQSETPKNIKMVDGWATCNTACGYTFDWKRTHHDISLRIDNIFDTRYKNYLANSRSVTLYEPGISATFQYAIEF